ncbi:unnamed protein product [Spirodela intermedia]|uniref:protein-serine/threonine phosphatase n=1 Tax=Spirodela intermedia TaxID=51605 RepID=A0A7I8IVI7_SPIIN|nr:unnamed protein product [Spirodela intermedia]CAA6661642.1 unnamed protein product [Spirodela intermedia]
MGALSLSLSLAFNCSSSSPSLEPNFAPTQASSDISSPNPPTCPICENTVTQDVPLKGSEDNQKATGNYVPAIRHGEWADIGQRKYMEDTHVCIEDIAKKFGCRALDQCSVSFYGVFDGHGGKDAAHFVRDNLPRLIVEDAGFPLELEKVVARSFVEIDAQFAQTCSGQSLLVANAGDCRAVLSRAGTAVEMSKDHRPCCGIERMRVEALGGFIDGEYLNGEIGVTRALGDWHLDGIKSADGGPLIAEPEMKMITLGKDDEFLVIGSDGLWDVFTSQNAVDFARRRLQDHNDARACSRELVEEAIKRGADDNLTALVVCFQAEPPAAAAVQRSRVRRCISAEGLQSLRGLLGGGQD